jgi:hypothetical protein
MDYSHSMDAGSSHKHSATPFRSSFFEAIHYWEPRRLIYNCVLAGVCVAWVVLTWPHFRSILNWSSALLLLFLGLIANACYCAAYFVDLPMQFSPLATAWRRRRWALWLAGMLFAILLANYWISDEIYPYVSQ